MEREFEDHWLAIRERMLLLRYVILGSVTDVASIGLIPLVAAPEVSRVVVAAHGLSLVLIGLAALLRNKGRALEMIAMSCIMASAAMYDGILSYCVGARPPSETLLAVAGAMAYSAVAIQFLPVHGKRLVLATAAIIAVAFFALRGLDNGVAVGAVFASVCLAQLLVRMFQDERTRAEARRELRFRRQIAPAHIIRRATSAGLSVQNMFRPELQFCVCVSSDWRNYQELSAHLSPSQLTMSLNEYYDLCEVLLNQSFPDGNYYTDWIADELFVVIYALPGASQDQIVRAALAFAESLILAKVEFTRMHGLPRAVDVGISCGEALVGIMGPAGHRKVTALGQVPGLSRRLQAAGKLLRHRCGERDRVLLMKACVDRLGDVAPGFLRYSLEGDESVRDINERELIYVEPQGSSPWPRQVA